MSNLVFLVKYWGIQARFITFKSSLFTDSRTLVYNAQPDDT